MKHLCGNGSVSVLPCSVYVFVEVFPCSNSRPYSLTSSLCINRILKYTLYIKNTRDSNDNNSSTSSSSTRANDNDNSNINSVYRSESHLKWSQCIWFMENLGHTQPRRDNNDHRAYTVWLNKNVASLHFYLLSTSSKLLLLLNESKTGAGMRDKSSTKFMLWIEAKPLNIIYRKLDAVQFYLVSRYNIAWCICGMFSHLSLNSG